jgi:hypothetical protein
MISKDGSLDVHWSTFENAATFSYARSISEKNKNRNTSSQNENFLPSTMTTSTILKYVFLLQLKNAGKAPSVNTPWTDGTIFDRIQPLYSGHPIQ